MTALANPHTQSSHTCSNTRNMSSRSCKQAQFRRVRGRGGCGVIPFDWRVETGESLGGMREKVRIFVKHRKCAGEWMRQRVGKIVREEGMRHRNLLLEAYRSRSQKRLIVPQDLEPSSSSRSRCYPTYRFRQDHPPTGRQDKHDELLIFGERCDRRSSG